MKTHTNKSLNFKLGIILLLAAVILAGCKKSNDKPGTTSGTVKVTGVTIDGPANRVVAVGGEVPLTVTITPADATNKTVAWSSDFPDIATVNSSTGVVKALKEGATIIKAISVDGFIKAECTVTVSSNIPVTGVTINGSANVTVAVNATAQLSVTITPANATNTTVSWTTNASDVATVSNTGIVTAHKAGSAIITATTVDGNKTATFNVTVPGYSITAEPTTLTFASLAAGYTTLPAAQTVTIRNTGNQAVTLNALPTLTNYTLSEGWSAGYSLAAGATTTFKVQPKSGLAANTYDAPINITGSNSVSASVNAKFTVTAPTQTNVEFTASPVGTFTAGTKSIEIKFSEPVTGLTANHITITNGTGAVTKGTLSGSGDTWTIGVTVTTEGTVNVKITNFTPYSFTPTAGRTVTVSEGGISIIDPGLLTYAVNFTAVANGNFLTNSTQITLTFDKSISGLTANHITITNGTGVVTKGTLSGSGTTYNIGITVTTAGDVTVKVANFSSYNFRPTAGQSVAVYKRTTIIIPI